MTKLKTLSIVVGLTAAASAALAQQPSAGDKMPRMQRERQFAGPLQDTIVQETQLQYNGMLVGVYDLLVSKQTQVQTARQYVAATRDFWLAWTDLERAVGTRVPFPVPDSAPNAPSDATPGPAHEGHKP